VVVVMCVVVVCGSSGCVVVVVCVVVVCGSSGCVVVPTGHGCSSGCV